MKVKLRKPFLTKRGLLKGECDVKEELGKYLIDFGYAELIEVVKKKTKQPK